MNPNNAYNIGKDVTFQITTPNGILPMPLTVTAFDSKPGFNKIRRTGLDGKTRGRNIPKGWEGTISVDRADSTLDDFFAAAEAGFFNGDVDGYKASITETIQESAGGYTQYRYVGVELAYDDAGKKEGDKEINQALSFFATTRIKVQ